MAENAQTAMDSLIMANNAKTLAKWKQEEKYTDAGTYLAWKLRDIIGEEAADALSFSFTDPLPPERVDISDEYWSNLNIDTNKQKELLSSDKYWRQKDMEAQQPSLMKELLNIFGRENKAFKY